MGVKTLYEYFYKLAYGDKGVDKATLVNDCLDIADAEIKANKDARHTQGTDYSNIVICADYANPDDAITAIGASNKTLLVTEVETCDTNFTVPANVTVKFERGGKWTINTGITVTFNGQIDAGLWQIFEYTGTGTISGTPLIDRVYPQWWATGDGEVGTPWVNDCIQSAFDFVSAGGTIYLVEGYYELSTYVALDKQINLIGEGIDKTIIITADANGFNISADYCVVKNLTIDGDAQTDNVQYRANINCAADYLLIENVEAKNSGYYGINIFQCNYNIYKNIYSHDNYRHGLHPGSDTLGKNMYNIYRDIYAWNNGNSGFKDRGSSVDVNEQLNNIFDGLICWNNLYGIVIDRQSGGTLSNSMAYGNTERGIWIGGSGISNFTVHDTNSSFNGLYGLYIEYAKNVNFTNVITKNNNTTNTIYIAGIDIGYSNNLTFVSCQSYDDRDSPLQAYGIRTTTKVDFLNIINCKLTPVKTGAIANSANATIKIDFAPLWATIPTYGTWDKTNVIKKSDVASNTSPGWVCLTSGTMGTLAATTGDTVNGKNILTGLSQLVGLTENVYLDVAGAYAAKYIKKTIAATASTTVDASSASGQKVLNVTATTNFATGETIIIDRATQAEVRVIASIQSGVSLTLTENLTNTYTNEIVENCIVMSDNAIGTVDNAAVTYHNATWQAMAELGMSVTSPTFVTKITTPIIELTSGQIAFPATAVPSANANTLDDYEEGTWTMGVSFGGGTTGITYTHQEGIYTKIGNLVTITGVIVLTSKGTDVGDVLITGLPFTVVNTYAGYTVASLRLDGVTFANQFQGWTIINTTTIGLFEITEAGVMTSLTNADFANTSSVRVNCTYRVN